MRHLRLLAALLCLSVPAAAAPLPDDFFVQTVATGFVLPISLAFHPDGRILVIEKSGLVRQVLPGANAPDPVPYLSLPNVESTDERGLFGIALDPDFESNGWLYLYYTHAPTARHRISRFTEVGGVGSLASEFVVWQDNEPWQGIGHIGGGMGFGPDGNLYLATGDENQGAQAQDLHRAGGKVIRVAPDGSIPPGNPFADGVGPNVDSIWARGLRNPFKAFWDLPTGRFFIGDVGQDTLEEIHEGSSGANFGWAVCEGSCGAGFSDPVHFYPHDAVGGSVTMGTVYRGSQFPASYQGALFFADFIQHWIRYLTFDAGGNVASVVDFDPDAQSVIYIGEGPDGSLYTLQLDSSRFFGTLRRILYTPNAPPVITQADASPTEGPGPTLTVNFSAAADDLQPVTFTWFFGDGSSAPGPSVSHQYAQRGQYQAFLEVSDGRLTARSDTIVVTVGAPPTVDLQSPASGTPFRAGDVVPLLASGTDPDGPPLPDSAFTWTFSLIHEQHAHPLGAPIVGTPASNLVIPEQGHDFHDQTAIEVRVTVTDSDGIEATDTALLAPEKAPLQFDSVPSGLQIFMDGIARTTPFVRNSLIGFRHEVSAPAQPSGGVLYGFESWSDGGNETHTIVTPTAGDALTASFAELGSARVVAGQQLLYLFDEGSGDVVEDRSGLLPPLDLDIQTPGAVAWLAGGGLDVQAPAVLTGEEPATRLRDALTTSGAATLEAWIEPANVTQDGPARIFTLSAGSTSPASFMLGEGRWGGQPADVVDVRFRTSQLPESTTTPAGTLAPALTHVVYTRSAAGETRIYLDGVLTTQGVAAGALDNWQDLAVSVANEPTGDRPWLGTLYLLSVYDRALSPIEVEQNFAAGPTPGAGLPACADGTDNDADGLVDLTDLGCADAGDLSERSDALPCDNGADDDGDGLVDLADPGCGGIFGIESPACNDGVDNDGDGLVDLADPNCPFASRNRERPGACGVGFEAALALGLLAGCRRLRRRR